LTPTTDTSGHTVEDLRHAPEYLAATVQQDKGMQQYFHQNVYRHYRNSAEDNPDLPMARIIFDQERKFSDYKALVALVSEQTDFPLRGMNLFDVRSSQKSQRALGQWILDLDSREGIPDITPRRVRKLKSALHDEIDQARFNSLASEWKRDTRFHSSIIEIAMHRAYQRIIGMGHSAIPPILNDLRKEPNQWFWALHAITGENPIQPDHRGKIREMVDDWLEWGRSRGYGC